MEFKKPDSYKSINNSQICKKNIKYHKKKNFFLEIYNKIFY